MVGTYNEDDQSHIVSDRKNLVLEKKQALGIIE